MFACNKAVSSRLMTPFSPTCRTVGKQAWWTKSPGTARGSMAEAHIFAPKRNRPGQNARHTRPRRNHPPFRRRDGTVTTERAGGARYEYMVERQRTEKNVQFCKAQRRLQYDNYRREISNAPTNNGPWYTKAEPTADAHDHYTETERQGPGLKSSKTSHYRD